MFVVPIHWFRNYLFCKCTCKKRITKSVKVNKSGFERQNKTLIKINYQMKKLILSAAILTVGFGNAKSVEIKTSKASTVIAESESEVTKKVLECMTWTYFSTCGVNATTCQEGWTSKDNIRWVKAIEANYCSSNAQFSQTSGLD